MPSRPTLLVVARVLAIGLLLFTGVAGLTNAASPMERHLPDMRRWVYFGVRLYGIAGLAAAALVMLRRRAARPALAIWGLALTAVAGTAPIAHGDGAPGIVAGAVGGAVATALVVWGVWRVLGRGAASDRDAGRGREADAAGRSSASTGSRSA